MNDFGKNIAGYTGVVKSRFFRVPTTEEGRKYRIEGGPGCLPDVGTRRTLWGRWAVDNMGDTISSYDFEYVLDKEGKRTSRLPEPEMDVTPVQLATEAAPGLPSKEELKAKKVRRKR